MAQNVRRSDKPKLKLVSLLVRYYGKKARECAAAMGYMYPTVSKLHNPRERDHN
jgi:hypothetical protein